MSIPTDLRVATQYDFFDPNGKPILGLEFFVHGYHPEVYKNLKPEDVPLERHETRKDVDFMKKWEYWLNDHRIYVKKDSLKQLSLLDY